MMIIIYQCNEVIYNRIFRLFLRPLNDSLFAGQKEYHSSMSSNSNRSLTETLKYRDILRARTAEGLYLPSSIALIVCLVTCKTSASSCCVILFLALSTRMLFFMSDKIISRLPSCQSSV